MSFLGEVRLEEEFGPFAAFKRPRFVPNLLYAQTLLLASSRPRRSLKVPCVHREERFRGYIRNESF